MRKINIYRIHIFLKIKKTNFEIFRDEILQFSIGLCDIHFATKIENLYLQFFV